MDEAERAGREHRARDIASIFKPTNMVLFASCIKGLELVIFVKKMRSPFQLPLSHP